MTSGCAWQRFQVPDNMKRCVVNNCTFTWKREFKLPWREAGPPNHLNDKVDSDQ